MLEYITYELQNLTLTLKLFPYTLDIGSVP